MAVKYGFLYCNMGVKKGRYEENGNTATDEDDCLLGFCAV
jgi:hypothetical protein